MSDDKMQTEFEAWAETKNLPIGRYHYGNTWGYADDRTNRTFEAYQAGRKAEREAMQREREEWSKAVNKAWIITASERIDEVKAIEKELEQLHAGLERVKTASVCPVDVRSMWVHESHGSLTVYCRTGESAKQLEKWISDSIKKRNEK